MLPHEITRKITSDLKFLGGYGGYDINLNNQFRMYNIQIDKLSTNTILSDCSRRAYRTGSSFFSLTFALRRNGAAATVETLRALSVARSLIRNKKNQVKEKNELPVR